MTAPDDPTKRANEPTTPDAIEADIVRTREQLGRTVEALSAKLDVKSRMRHKVGSARTGGRHAVARARQAASDDAGRRNDVVPASAALLAVALGAIVMSIARSRRT